MDHGNPKKRPYHHGDLCRAILDAAERRLETGGLQAVTVRACARDAGVSPGAPLHHFGSLRGLLSALAARGFERLLARLDADLAAPDVRAPASLLVGAYVAFAVSSRPPFRPHVAGRGPGPRARRTGPQPARRPRTAPGAVRRVAARPGGAAAGDPDLVARPRPRHAAAAWSHRDRARQRRGRGCGRSRIS